MDCPIDGTTLVMADRQGIEIDYCPECRGVWLDRGELDKLIERSATATAGGPAESSSAQPKQKKRSSWLGDIFELGGE
jgi:Zn-finger nucleic acid-binding protein